MTNQDPYFKTKNGKVHNGDCLDVMQDLSDNSIDTILTDPPYALNFMGKGWDKVLPSIGIWKEALRVAKPGATIMAFGGTRTYHRLACAIEDAGWVIKDCMMWVYGSGFPKSTNIGKAMDKLQGNNRKVVGFKKSPDGRDYSIENAAKKGESGGENAFKKSGMNMEKLIEIKGNTAWEGWGTALKPAYEPIVIAMKPNDGTYANNALKWGVAGINIDGSRIETSDNRSRDFSKCKPDPFFRGKKRINQIINNTGRFPANIIHDGSDEVMDLFPETKNGTLKANRPCGTDFAGNNKRISTYDMKGDSGSAARFFYCAKSSKSERGENNNHPTVKPIKLIEYLCKLTETPTKGVVLDMFGGSGTTGIACERLNRKYILIEKEEKYCKIIKERLEKEIAQNRLF